jgi:hypothetical protein
MLTSVGTREYSPEHVLGTSVLPLTRYHNTLAVQQHALHVLSRTCSLVAIIDPRNTAYKQQHHH